MNPIHACIDALGDANAGAAVDAAAWASARLGAQLELLHVLERAQGGERAAQYSGAIGLGSQEALLEQLTVLDEQRGLIAQELGREVLAWAAQRARQSGAAAAGTRLLHGDLTECVLTVEPESQLIVLGEHTRRSKSTRLHVDHHVERVVRAVHRPVLVVPGPAFAAPRGFVVAYDGSAQSLRAVDAVASSPLLQGLPAEVVVAGDPHVPLEGAEQVLREARFQVSCRRLDGDPEQAIPAHLQTCGATLLVMGAYGHSRVRHLIVGSNTTALLRKSGSPVLVLR